MARWFSSQKISSGTAARIPFYTDGLIMINNELVELRFGNIEHGIDMVAIERPVLNGRVGEPR